MLQHFFLYLLSCGPYAEESIQDINWEYSTVPFFKKKKLVLGMQVISRLYYGCSCLIYLNVS